jgi:hypothetical protein
MADLAFPNVYSEGTLYQYDPGVGEPRFWRYDSNITGTWRSVRSYLKTYNRYGSLAPNTGNVQFFSSANLTITNISASCGSAPLSGNINIVVVKDGANVANLVISAGNTQSATVNYYSDYTSLTLTTSDYLTINLANTNATYYGNNLSVFFRYVYT